MNAFESGELVDVTIRGARVGAIVKVGHHEILRIALGQRELEVPLGTGAQVTRVAPKEWPPQRGDVWEDTHGGSWWGRATGKGVELEAEAGGTSAASWVLDRYGPLKLAHRRGWTPEPVPAADEPAKVDQRAEVIAGLRELADWYEGDPDVPMRPYGFEYLHSISQSSEDADRAELLRIAARFGEDPDLTASHPYVRKMFRGGVSVRAYYIPPPATEDLARGGEVGASAEGSGASTSAWTPPTDDGRPLPRLVGLDPIPDPALVDEQVWVSTERKGIDFHAIAADGQRAGCGRSTHTGRRLPRREAETFGRPCPRCYPGGAA